jgi:predicted flavoprotein YhiN
LAYLNLDEFFTGLLNKRVGQIILKISGLKLTDKVSSLNKNIVKQIVSNIKAFSFDVVSTTGFDNSQVTAGGIDTTSFWSESMMSKNDKGLFAAGELLDVDGDCGGFNLHWAWSSAMCAADGILKYLGGVK